MKKRLSTKLDNFQPVTKCANANKHNVS